MPPDVRGRLPRTAGWQPALPCTKIILMPDRASIHAVTVTQNTSAFTELMLRTLFLTNELGGFEFRLTVLDNNSSDPEFGALKAYLGAQQIPLAPTGFSYYVAAEQHGAALTDFVRDHDDCTHYLFLDADMWFVEQNTVRTMLDELRAAGPDIFAVQARIYGYYVGFVYEGRDGIPGWGPNRYSGHKDDPDHPLWRYFLPRHNNLFASRYSIGSAFHVERPTGKLPPCSPRSS